MPKHLVLYKLCSLNELYLTGELDTICSYLKGLKRSYEGKGYHSFRLDKDGSTWWLFGSKVDMARNEDD